MAIHTNVHPWPSLSRGANIRNRDNPALESACPAMQPRPAGQRSWEDKEGQTWGKGVCCAAGLPFPWIFCTSTVHYCAMLFFLLRKDLSHPFQRCRRRRWWWLWQGSAGRVLKPQGNPEMSTSTVPTVSQLHMTDSSHHPTARAAHHTWPNAASQVVIAHGPQMAEQRTSQLPLHRHSKEQRRLFLTFQSWPWERRAKMPEYMPFVSNSLHQQSSFHAPVWRWSKRKGTWRDKRGNCSEISPEQCIFQYLHHMCKDKGLKGTVFALCPYSREPHNVSVPRQSDRNHASRPG